MRWHSGVAANEDLFRARNPAHFAMTMWRHGPSGDALYVSELTALYNEGRFEKVPPPPPAAIRFREQSESGVGRTAEMSRDILGKMGVKLYVSGGSGLTRRPHSRVAAQRSISNLQRGPARF